MNFLTPPEAGREFAEPLIVSNPMIVLATGSFVVFLLALAVAWIFWIRPSRAPKPAEHRAEHRLA